MAKGRVRPPKARRFIFVLVTSLGGRDLTWWGGSWRRRNAAPGRPLFAGRGPRECRRASVPRDDACSCGADRRDAECSRLMFTIITPHSLTDWLAWRSERTTHHHWLTTRTEHLRQFEFRASAAVDLFRADSPSLNSAVCDHCFSSFSSIRSFGTIADGRKWKCKRTWILIWVAPFPLHSNSAPILCSNVLRSSSAPKP